MRLFSRGQKVVYNDCPRRSSLWRRLVWWGLLPAALTVGLYLLCVRDPHSAEFYSRSIFPILTWPMRKFTDLFSFSLTQLLLFIAVPLLLAALIWFIWRLIVRPGRWRAVLTAAVNIIIIAAWAALLFMLTHGINYHRHSLSAIMNLHTQPYGTEELVATADWLVGELNEVAALAPRDEEGVFRPNDSCEATFERAGAIFDNLAKSYPELGIRGVGRPKSVWLSHYWSYTGIAGMYFPYFVEPNLNVDAPESGLLFSTLHELAHTAGYAREDEANFLAFLAGHCSDDDEYKYSAYVQMFSLVGHQLNARDADAYKEVAGRIHSGVWVDYRNQNIYWDQFKGKVQEISNKVNDTYLKVQKQEKGVQSYGEAVDLLIAWYLSESATSESGK